MEEIKSAAIEAHGNLRHILFQLEHLRSDFSNEMPKNSVGQKLSESFNEFCKTAQAAVYDCADFCFSLQGCESTEDVKQILEGVEV